MGGGRSQDESDREGRGEGTTNWRNGKQKRLLSGPKGCQSLAEWRCPLALAVKQAESYFLSRLKPPPVDSINLVSLLGKRGGETGERD